VALLARIQPHRAPDPVRRARTIRTAQQRRNKRELGILRACNGPAGRCTSAPGPHATEDPVSPSASGSHARVIAFCRGTRGCCRGAVAGQPVLGATKPRVRPRGVQGHVQVHAKGGPVLAVPQLREFGRDQRQEQPGVPAPARRYNVHVCDFPLMCPPGAGLSVGRPVRARLVVNAASAPPLHADPRHGAVQAAATKQRQGARANGCATQGRCPVRRNPGECPHCVVGVNRRSWHMPSTIGSCVCGAAVVRVRVCVRVVVVVGSICF